MTLSSGDRGAHAFKAFAITTLVVASALAFEAGSASSQEGPTGTIAFEGKDGLYLVEAAGGMARKIPGTRPGDGDPAWSPDGLRIVFDRGRENRDIWVIDAVGGNPRRLTFAPGVDAWPRWAPHGRAVTFESERDGGELVFTDELAAYVVNLDSGQARRVSRHATYPDWRADGRIVFQDAIDYDLMSVRPYGGDRRTDSRDAPADRWAVRVSEDGRMIVYTDGGDPPRRLYTAESDGTGTRLLYRSQQETYSPAWSPDGGWITFSMGVGDQLDVYAIRADGTGLRRYTRGRIACCSDWRQ